MILFNQELTNILRYLPDLEAFLGTGESVRIYAVKTPDANEPFPRLAFQTISNMPMTCLNGTIGLAKRRVQITAYAKDATTAEKIKQIVQDYLLTYRGDVIEDVQPAAYEYEDFEADTRVYSAQVDYWMTVSSAPGVKS